MKIPIQDKLKQFIIKCITEIPVENKLISIVKESYGDEINKSNSDLFGILCEKADNKIVYLLPADMKSISLSAVPYNEDSFKERHLIKEYPELVRNTPHSYLAQTLRSLGMTEEDNKKYAFFDTDQNDNLIINYCDIEGRLHNPSNEEDTTEKGWKRHYHVMRYKYPKMVFNNEKGETEELKYNRVRMLPYFTPSVLEAYKAKTEIDTLYFIEGEKKAIAAWKAGLFVIGLGSIHGFYDPDIKGKLHPDIIDAITGLNPEKVVLINDADTLTIKYKEDKDLSKRVTNFTSALVNFREAISFLLLDKKLRFNYIYYAHIRTQFWQTAKGLDDLLAAYPARQQDIISDLEKLDLSKEFFSCLNLTSFNVKLINKYFGINDVENFYNIYKDFILNNKFIFRNIQYQFDEAENEIKKIKHQDSEIFIRILDKYAKVVEIPLAGGTTATDIKKFGKGEIIEDYGKFFPKYVMKVDGLTIFPDNTPHFPQILETEKEGRVFRHYNMYKPIRHQPSQGDITNSLIYLRHVFGGKATLEQGENFEVQENNILGDPLSIALDWLTILYKYPKNFLPVILLLSKEQESGKTTMIDWLHAIYETNLISMKMEQFLGNFNKHWAFKLIRCIDEGSLDLEKAQAKNSFKNLTTAKNILVELKGIDIQEIPNYGKMIICANDEDKVMRMESEDSRFFPVKVPALKKKDPEFLTKLKEEIPAFLYFLSKREIFHPKESRLWFRVDYLKTEQFRKIVNATRASHEIEIDEFVKDKLLTYRLQEVHMTLEYMRENINKNAKFKISISQIQDYLKKRGYKVNKNGQLSSDGNGRMKIPYGYQEVGGKIEIQYQSVQGRYYIFNYSEWLEENERIEVERGLDGLDMIEFNPQAVKQISAEEIKQYIYAYITGLEPKSYKISDLVRGFNSNHSANLDPIEFTSYAEQYQAYAFANGFQNGSALHSLNISLSMDKIEIKEPF